jgi:hypothetical protein
MQNIEFQFEVASLYSLYVLKAHERQTNTLARGQ